MSTLTVSTINTANGTTDLTLRSGNASSSGVILQSNGRIVIQGNSTSNTVSINSTAVSVNSSLVLSSTLNANGGVGSSGQVLASNGSTGSPYWTTISTTTSSIVSGTSNVSVVSSGGNVAITTAGTTSALVDTSGNFYFNSGAGSARVAYGCRAWVNFSAITPTSGTPTIRSSGNISSITDNGVGNFTFNFATAMPDTNYAFSYGVLKNESGIGTTIAMLLYGNDGTYTTSALQLICRQVNDAIGGNIDPFTGCLMIFR